MSKESKNTTDNLITRKYKMKTNPNKIILEILWYKMKTRDLKWCEKS